MLEVSAMRRLFPLQIARLAAERRRRFLIRGCDRLSQYAALVAAVEVSWLSLPVATGAPPPEEGTEDPTRSRGVSVGARMRNGEGLREPSRGDIMHGAGTELGTSRDSKATSPLERLGHESLSLVRT